MFKFKLSKVFVYKVYPKNNPDLWYLVDAPNNWVAKWCGAAILNNTYASFFAANNMVAKRWRDAE